MIEINVRDVLLILVLIAVLILVVYLILLVKKLMITADKANKVLDDTSVVSEIAAKDVKAIDGAVTNISSTVNGISNELGKSTGFIKTATNVGKAFASVASYVKDKDKDEVEDLRDNKKKKK